MGFYVTVFWHCQFTTSNIVAANTQGPCALRRYSLRGLSRGALIGEHHETIVGAEPLYLPLCELEVGRCLCTGGMDAMIAPFGE